jgi:hypothetical protein
MHQQLWGYKVGEKLYLGVREEIRLNITVLDNIYLLRNLLSVMRKDLLFSFNYKGT